MAQLKAAGKTTELTSERPGYYADQFEHEWRDRNTGHD
jgi:hypothetical protein